MSCCGDWCGNSDWCGNKNEGEKEKEVSLKEKQNNNINKNEGEKKNKVFKKEKQNNNINKNNEENKIGNENTQQKEQTGYLVTNEEKDLWKVLLNDNLIPNNHEKIIPEIKVKLGSNLYLMRIQDAKNLTEIDIKDIAQNYNVTKIHNKDNYFNKENKYKDIYLIRKVEKEKLNEILNAHSAIKDEEIKKYFDENDDIILMVNHDMLVKSIFSKIDQEDKLSYYHFGKNGKSKILPMVFGDHEGKEGLKVFHEYDLFSEKKFNFKDLKQEFLKALNSKEVKEFIEKQEQKQMANKNSKNNLDNENINEINTNKNNLSSPYNP